MKEAGITELEDVFWRQIPSRNNFITVSRYWGRRQHGKIVAVRLIICWWKEVERGWGGETWTEMRSNASRSQHNSSLWRANLFPLGWIRYSSCNKTSMGGMKGKISCLLTKQRARISEERSRYSGNDIWIYRLKFDLDFSCTSSFIDILCRKPWTYTVSSLALYRGASFSGFQ